MAISKRGLQNIRTLSDIRTHSGTVDQTFIPHKAYMKLASLEMEKARRGKERESATHRIEIIDARLQKVEAEKDVLLRALDERGGCNPTDDALNTKPKPGPRRKTGGFKLRY